VIVLAVLLLGWRSHANAVASDVHHEAKRHIDRHVKDQKARMRDRYRKG
jgi:hypothetical protein